MPPATSAGTRSRIWGATSNYQYHLASRRRACRRRARSDRRCIGKAVGERLAGPLWRKHLMRRTIALRSSTEAVLEDGRRRWVVRVSAADRRCAGVCAGCHADRRRLGHSPLREQARYRALRVRTRSNRRSARRGAAPERLRAAHGNVGLAKHCGGLASRW